MQPATTETGNYVYLWHCLPVESGVCRIKEMVPFFFCQVMSIVVAPVHRKPHPKGGWKRFVENFKG